MLRFIQTQWNHVSGWISKLISVDPDLNTLPSPSESFEACSLPADIEQYLAQQLPQLLPPEPYLSAIHTALTNAMAQWTTGTANSLLLLSSATEDLSRILTVALDRWQSPLDAAVTQWPLPWHDRPPDPQRLTTDLQQVLSKSITAIQVEVERSPSRPLVIVPSLEQLFLRQADGLEAVAQLIHTIAAHPEYFWLVGCNEWAWAYLNRVCYLSAYFDTRCTLPALDGDALKDWLTQAVDLMGVSFAHQSEGAADGSARLVMGLTTDQVASYFSRLATLAEGLAPTAAHLWLRSLEVPALPSHPELITPPTRADQVPALRTVLQTGKITLPKLPALDAAERYLLHAVLLHGAITLPHLVLSLADPVQRVQSQLQSLLRTGLLQQQQAVLRINPIYYPQIKADLKRNNFLLEVD
jgi:hypothetical protein